MPVDSVHALYEEHLEQWQQNRIVLKGPKAVKNAGETFLPKLGGHTSDLQTGESRYSAYKKRAQFFNATARTREGLVGAIIRKDAEIEGVSQTILDELQTLGFDGQSFDELQKDQLDETVGIGRVGYLLDASEKNAERPYLSRYHAEAITNWGRAIVGDRRMLNMVVLKEQRRVGGDEFTPKMEDIYRVLRLGIPSFDDEEELAVANVSIPELMDMADEQGSINVYYQEVWIKKHDDDGDHDGWMREKIIVPRMFGGRLMTWIPFYFFNKGSCECDPEGGPLDDVMEINLSLYRTSADLEHGRHFTALPTAWAAGFGVDGTNKYLIGSESAWVAEDAQARCGYLEFTGAGLASLEKAESDKKKDMAVLGARLLEEPSENPESGKAIGMRHAGERSVLANVAIFASEGWTKVVRDYIKWRKGDVEPVDKVAVSLNQDFVSEGMEPQALQTLVAALQGGAISPNVFFYNLERAEMYPEEWTYEQEMDAIAAGLPMQSLTSGNEKPNEAQEADADS